MTLSIESTEVARLSTNPEKKSKYGRGRSRSFNLPDVMIDWLEANGGSAKVRALIESNPSFVKYAQERGF